MKKESLILQAKIYESKYTDLLVSSRKTESTKQIQSSVGEMGQDDAPGLSRLI